VLVEQLSAVLIIAVIILENQRIPFLSQLLT